jgi:hypothetical protein
MVLTSAFVTTPAASASANISVTESPLMVLVSSLASTQRGT